MARRHELDPVRRSPRRSRWTFALLSGSPPRPGRARAMLPTTRSSAAPRSANGTVDSSPAEIALKFSAAVGPSPQVSMTCGDPGIVQSLGRAGPVAGQVTLPVALLVPRAERHVHRQLGGHRRRPAAHRQQRLRASRWPTNRGTVATTTTTVARTAQRVGGPPPPARRPSINRQRERRRGSDCGWRTSSRSVWPVPSAQQPRPRHVVRLARRHRHRVARRRRVHPHRAALAHGLEARRGRTYLYAGTLAADLTGGGFGSTMLPTGRGDWSTARRARRRSCASCSWLGSSYVVARPERAIDPGSQMAALGAARHHGGHDGVQPRGVRIDRIRRRHGARPRDGRVVRRAHAAQPSGARRAG